MATKITITLTGDQITLLLATLNENLNDDPISEQYKAFCRRLIDKISKELAKS
jgi:hypothetical protein